MADALRDLLAVVHRENIAEVEQSGLTQAEKDALAIGSDVIRRQIRDSVDTIARSQINRIARRVVNERMTPIEAAAAIGIKPFRAQRLLTEHRSYYIVRVNHELQLLTEDTVQYAAMVRTRAVLRAAKASEDVVAEMVKIASNPESNDFSRIAAGKELLSIAGIGENAKAQASGEQTKLSRELVKVLGDTLKIVAGDRGQEIQAEDAEVVDSEQP